MLLCNCFIFCAVYCTISHKGASLIEKYHKRYSSPLCLGVCNNPLDSVLRKILIWQNMPFKATSKSVTMAVKNPLHVNGGVISHVIIDKS